MEILKILLLIVIIYCIVTKLRKNNDSTTSYQSNAFTQQPKTINQPALAINSCSADALINSPYYSKYKSTFDWVRYNGEQPKYKIDWLLQSLDMGHELEDSGRYVIESIKKDLPYFCETEDEYNQFFKLEQPVTLGSIDGMMNICFLYHDANRKYSHLAKQRYWQKRIQELAFSGNLEAQGALCSGYGEMAFSIKEVEKFNEKYKATLLSLAESGNAYAQLSVGKYLTPHGSIERTNWLLKAANQGLSDAWFELSKVYGRIIVMDENNNIRKVRLAEEEERHLKEEIAKCCYRGAEANNGVMAAYCQLKVGEYYEDGDLFFPTDIEKAEYWYQKSENSGEVRAKYRLDHLRNSM